MRKPIDVETRVWVTLYYLSDEGRMRETASAFGIAKGTVSVIIRRVTQAISDNLAEKYINYPTIYKLNYCFIKGKPMQIWKSLFTFVFI